MSRLIEMGNGRADAKSSTGRFSRGNYDKITLGFESLNLLDERGQEMPEGYTTHYKNFACRPVRPLAPEPPDWEVWRSKRPASEQGHADSRDARYLMALKTHEHRAWPLPYESYIEYVDRQINILNRPVEGFEKFYQEYAVWMTGDRQFHSTDLHFLYNFMRTQIRWNELQAAHAPVKHGH